MLGRVLNFGVSP